jgi:hypothetical protein
MLLTYHSLPVLPFIRLQYLIPCPKDFNLVGYAARRALQLITSNKTLGLEERFRARVIDVQV